MKNIQVVIRPLSIVLCLCGFKVFEFPGNRPRLCLTIFYILLTWLFYIYFFIEAYIFLNKFEIGMPIITMFYTSISIAYILFSLIYNKKFKNCLNKLDIVIDTLEKLGTPKNYIKLHISVKCLITGWIMSIFFINMADSLWIIGRIPKSYVIIAIYQTFVLNHTFHLSMLYDLTFIMLLRYIEFQFKHINQHIQELIEEKKQRVQHIWATTERSSSFLTHQHMSDTETIKQLVWILMHVHLELSSISRELNTVFGFQMVIQVITLQIAIIQVAYSFYKAIMVISTYSIYLMTIDVLSALFWGIFNIIKMIIFNCVCEKMCTQANRIELFLNKLTNLTIDVETQNNITQFLLHLLRRPLRISGLGFYFGYNFLQWIMGNVATLIIIVIQTTAFEKY